MALSVGLFAVARAFPAQTGGIVVGWGNIDFGEYGIVSGFQTNGVVAISNQVLSNAVAVSAGSMFSLALTKEGKVMGWGRNGLGELNLPSSPFPGTSGHVLIDGLPLVDVISIACGNDHSLALKKDGTVLVWGGLPDVTGKKGPEVQLPEVLGNVKAVAAGMFRSLVLKENGTVEIWGRRSQVPTGLNEVVAIAAGAGIHGREDVALRRDGTVVTWSVYGVPASKAPQPEGMSNIVAIAAGTAHVLALEANGTVWGWGFNSNGQATGVPTTEGSKMAAGIVHVDGKAVTDIKAIAAGVGCSLALRKDGTLVFWGDDLRGLLKPPAYLNGVIAIALSESHGLAITTNMALISR